MVPWGGIMVHTPLENLDRAKAGHYHTSIGYGIPYEIPLQQCCGAIFLWLQCWPIHQLVAKAAFYGALG